jgi:hypothetical protein
MPKRRHQITKPQTKSAPATIERAKRRTYHRATERAAFAGELSKQMRIHNDTPRGLWRAAKATKRHHAECLLKAWINGGTIPATAKSFRLLEWIEKRYGLPTGHFKAILLPETPTELAIKSVAPVEQLTMRWHLPADFDNRSSAERQNILCWIKQNVLTCSTEYGKYMRERTTRPFALRMPTMGDVPAQQDQISRFNLHGNEDNKECIWRERYELPAAPKALVKEIRSLIRFKRLPISPLGFNRYCRWSQHTASYRSWRDRGIATSWTTRC